MSLATPTSTSTPTSSRVKVHPHKPKVNAGIEECISVTPDTAGGHAYYRGTVVLEQATLRIHSSGVARAQREQVRNVHAWAVGTLAAEDSRQVEDARVGIDGMTQVTYHYQTGRFVTLDGSDVSDLSFARVVCRGRDFFVELPA